LQSTRVDLVNGLKSADVDVPGRKRLWGRNVLVVAQVSASLMLLTAAFLMVRGFQHDLQEGTGFAKDHLLMVNFDPRLVQYNAGQTKQFYKLLAERVREARRWTRWMKDTSRPWGFRFCVAEASWHPIPRIRRVLLS
jgi:hypothetical protein